MKTLVSDARSSGSTQPRCRGWRKSAPTSRDRLQEAKEQGWLGEVAAIETTLAAAAQKLEAMRELTARSTTVSLGMPGFRRSSPAQTAGRRARA